MLHLHLNDMEILGTKYFISKGFEPGATLSYRRLAGARTL